jgi:hypothetical protein
MTTRTALCVVLVLVVLGAPSLAAQVGGAQSALSLSRAMAAEAGKQAETASPAETLTQGASEGWEVLRLLTPGTEVSVETAGNSGMRWHFVAASDREVSLRTWSGPTQERFLREDIVRVRVRRTTHRAAHQAFVAAGVTLGLVFGVRSAAHFAYSPCGGSCTDEATLMVLSLAGLPVAGGVLGWQLSAVHHWQLIYERGD